MRLFLATSLVWLALVSGDYNTGPFVPAKPGETPHCARTGKSYCEYVDGYPIHVISYLLEHGVFDSNTLFRSDEDAKPPELQNLIGQTLNDTDGIAEVKSIPHHFLNQHHYGATFQPARLDLGPFHHPVGQEHPQYHGQPKPYRDYGHYYRSEPAATPQPAGYGTLFLGDLKGRDKPKLKKPHYPGKADHPHKEKSPHSYGYKIVNEDIAEEMHLLQKQHPPSKGYLPPVESREAAPFVVVSSPTPDYLLPHSSPKPVPDYLPPVDNVPVSAPSAYLPPVAATPDYLPPVPASSDYLPPLLPNPGPEYLPPQDMVPPSKSYLPPPPTHKLPALQLPAHHHHHPSIPIKDMQPPTKSYLPPHEPKAPADVYLPALLDNHPGPNGHNLAHFLPSDAPLPEGIHQPHIQHHGPTPGPHYEVQDFHSKVKSHIQSLHDAPKTLNVIHQSHAPGNSKPVDDHVDLEDHQPTERGAKTTSFTYHVSYPIQFESKGSKYKTKTRPTTPVTSPTTSKYVEDLEAKSDHIQYSNREALMKALQESAQSIEALNGPETLVKLEKLQLPSSTETASSSASTASIVTAETSTFSTTSEASSSQATSTEDAQTSTQASSTTTSQSTTSFIPSSQPSQASSTLSPERISGRGDNDQVSIKFESKEEDLQLVPVQEKEGERTKEFTDAILRETVRNPEPEAGKILPRSFAHQLAYAAVHQAGGPAHAAFQQQSNPERLDVVGDSAVFRSTTPFGHSYRVTTPSSTVFVHRSFGISTDGKPFKRELESATTSDKSEENPKYNLIHKESTVFNKNEKNPTNDSFKSLKEAVDVLTRSSLGYLNLDPLVYLSSDGQDIDIENILPKFDNFPAESQQVDNVYDKQQRIAEILESLKESSTTEAAMKGPEGLEVAVNLQAGVQANPEDNAISGNDFDNLLVKNYLRAQSADHLDIRENAPARQTFQPAEPTQDSGIVIQLTAEGAEPTEIDLDNLKIVEVDREPQFNRNQRRKPTGKPIKFSMEEKLVPRNSVKKTQFTSFSEIERGGLWSHLSMGSSNPAVKFQDKVPSSVPNVGSPITQSTFESTSAKQGRTLDISGDSNRVRFPSDEGQKKRVLFPSFNNSVYIPRAVESVHISVSPRNELKVRLDQMPEIPGSTPAPSEMAQVIDLTGDKPMAEDMEETSRSKRHHDPQEFNVEKKTTFEDDWIGMQKDEKKRSRRSPQDLEEEVTTSEVTSEDSENVDNTEAALTDDTDENFRGRRQSTDPDQLCPTVSQFVMPRAAVNTKGDWMYVVNMDDQLEFQQFVRTEICTSKTCRGLCSVPSGLQTECSQQYVQKKLVALHPNGDRLIEDNFWFPSCCVCQVKQNLEL